MLKQNYISVSEAHLIKECLRFRVQPSENRVLLFTPSDDSITNSGIIIPGNIQEGKPRKGVAILTGELDECHLSFKSMLRAGNIVTYGLYAGKEVEFDETYFTQEVSQLISKGKFTILDTTEVIMSEINPNN